ncbi:hypothetical protein SAICODRAFT_8863 [Saitoella complicata NRRL Y-17804]|nr:uncharacterized protein SAICODRAFT_8863 [Saitoella complicata NRRL Y-17804]ODQ51566.1 hypothetical protein SAICODRAFT_8863 [Saitoella complicata NRRL Y-17804]
MNIEEIQAHLCTIQYESTVWEILGSVAAIITSITYPPLRLVYLYGVFDCRTWLCFWLTCCGYFPGLLYVTWLSAHRHRTRTLRESRLLASHPLLRPPLTPPHLWSIDASGLRSAHPNAVPLIPHTPGSSPPRPLQRSNLNPSLPGYEQAARDRVPEYCVYGPGRECPPRYLTHANGGLTEGMAPGTRAVVVQRLRAAGYEVDDPGRGETPKVHRRRTSGGAAVAVGAVGAAAGTGAGGVEREGGGGTGEVRSALRRSPSGHVSSRAPSRRPSVTFQEPVATAIDDTQTQTHSPSQGARQYKTEAPRSGPPGPNGYHESGSSTNGQRRRTPSLSEQGCFWSESGHD